MKFLSASLSLVLPLLTFARATIFEDNGYKKVSDRQMDSILFRDGDKDYQMPERQNKLSFPDIYYALAKRHKRKPEDIDWIITEVAGDIETEGMILGIREGRKVGLHDEVTVAPNDKEWNDILGTKYYRNAASVSRKEVERVIIRTHKRTLFGDDFDVDSLIFHFPTQENTNSQEETTPESADDTENSNAMGWMDFWKKECIKGLKGKVADELHAGEWLDAALNIIYNAEKLEEEVSLARLKDARADLNLALKGDSDAAVSRT
ncbi:hypothetical protein CFO_g3653 [Ceratocystis platani]|uniref:Uncharacterized protein n=1 Tax=Ceratocystis fimbriata f. sp. platani TaxID=88771 RepID=A0A0F8B2F0_CERFI|nr:hypothetical protein CFO_g3653 [Ceratocystis platani]